MVVRAVRLHAVDSVLTLLYFEEIWVIFLLLPAMRILTLVLVRATLSVRAYEIVDLPLRTHFA